MTAPESKPAKVHPVKTAARTFEVFAAAKGPLTLTEIAVRLDSPISNCHTPVRTLQTRGYVYVLDERKRVYPSKRLLTMAQEVASNDPVLERIGPVLAALQQTTSETVILGKRQGQVVTYLHVLEVLGAAARADFNSLARQLDKHCVIATPDDWSVRSIV